MTLEEFDKACEAPDEDELNFRQWQLLHTLEFMVEMEVMWNGAPPKES